MHQLHKDPAALIVYSTGQLPEVRQIFITADLHHTDLVDTKGIDPGRPGNNQPDMAAGPLPVKIDHLLSDKTALAPTKVAGCHHKAVRDLTGPNMKWR